MAASKKIPTPLDSSVALVSYEVKSGSDVIPDKFYVKSISISMEVDKIPTADLEIVDGDVTKPNFEASASKIFEPGAEITVSVGYNTNTNEIFKGIIIKHSIQSSGKDRGTLSISCKGKMLKMTVTRQNRLFENQTDNAAFSTIMGDYSDVEGTFATTSVEHKELVQYYMSDWDFIVSRAQVNGMMVLAKNNEINVAKPDFSATPAMKLTYGRDLKSFSAEMDASTQISSVQTSGWDISTQDLEQPTSNAPSGSEQGGFTSAKLAAVVGSPTSNLQSTGTMQEADLQAWADAQYLRAWASKIQGRCKFQGSDIDMLGKLVQIEGVGKTFTGTAFVKRVSHSISVGTWDTELSLGMDKEWFLEKNKDVQAPKASGLIGAVSGLKIGIVQKIDTDPEGQYRVQILIPIMQDKQDYVWARLSTSYASGGAGTFFFPEINDEVLVGFLNEDPRYPVILGSFWSDKNKAPNEPDEPNTLKSIVAKSGAKLQFDDEKKIITIDTPGGNSAVLDDDAGSIVIKDSNGNQIEMSSSGITISSGSDLKLTAKGNVDIDSKGNLTENATGNVTVSGNQISQSAKSAYSAQGQASTTVSSSGTTTLKGTMVMIN